MGYPVTFTDQTGFAITLPKAPQRIISVVPSQTELLHALGLQQRVVGITKFCLYPRQWRSSLPFVGGTKNIKPEVVAQLQPDLIIGNKEENQKENILALRAQYPVWLSDIFDLPDALAMIKAVGHITQTAEKATTLAHNIGTAFNALTGLRPVRALYLIWHKPFMAAASNTFINQMLRYAGFSNVLAGHQRYPELTEQQIIDLNPEVILLSSEPFPFKQKHVAMLNALCPNAKVTLANGELFSWYGSRLLKSPPYFLQLRAQLGL